MSTQHTDTNSHKSSDANVSPTVTTGPLPASEKAYSEPQAYPGMRVPHRDILISDPDQPSVRVYDTSGPYSDDSVAIDPEKGCLLYTSPSPRDATLSRMPSSA